MKQLYHGFKEDKLLVDCGGLDPNRIWDRMRKYAAEEHKSWNRETMRKHGYEVRPTGWIAL